jgi:hypothetical protein
MKINRAFPITPTHVACRAKAFLWQAMFGMASRRRLERRKRRPQNVDATRSAYRITQSLNAYILEQKVRDVFTTPGTIKVIAVALQGYWSTIPRALNHPKF